MRKNQRNLAFLVLLTAWVVVGASAAQAQCVSGQEGGHANRYSGGPYVYKGMKGNHFVPISPAVASGTFIAHAAQALTVNTADFVAIGTAKGVGTGNCPADYDATWQVYVDGFAFGVYFCTAPFGQVSAGTTRSFEISYGFCPYTPAGNKWLFYWHGSLVACKTINATAAAALSVMAEDGDGSATDRNIDVGYRSLQYKTTGSWLGWGSTNAICLDPNYSLSQYPTGNVDIYLAPWGS